MLKTAWWWKYFKMWVLWRQLRPLHKTSHPFHKFVETHLWYIWYINLGDMATLFLSIVDYPEHQIPSLCQKGEGLPRWRSGWESACQCRGHGFEPWSGKIPHAAEQLGPWATVTEPARLEPVLRNGRGRDGERPAHRDEEWTPFATTGESPRTETKTQHSQK